MRRPPVVLGMAALTCLALLVAVLLILFSVNPGVDRNEGEIRKAVESQHAIICAQVQNTANAYRFRSLTPIGEVEPIRHFLTRMQAQAQTLRLARGSECRSAPGFPPVGLQVKRALHQIHEILQHFEPRLREPVSEGISHAPSEPNQEKHPGFSPAYSKPPDTGVDENGVPAHLKHQLAPSAPILPETGRQHSPPPPEESEVGPAPVESVPAPPGETRAIGVPKRSELPTVAVEISKEGIDVQASPEANPQG